MRAIAIVVALCALGRLAHAQVTSPIGAATQQLVTVTTDDWDAVKGTLQAWERTGSAPWRKVGAAVKVVVGRAGLAWGAGEDPLEGRGLTDLAKREGDSRAPAGIFRIDGAFGRDAAPPGTKLSFRRTTQTLLCVDDPGSDDYNRIVETARARPHASAEKLAATAQYALAIVVAHNRAPTVAGKGSCIFMHVWGSEDTGTAGCTAMARAGMVQLLKWLDPKKEPRLVQLTKEAYLLRRGNWLLP